MKLFLALFLLTGVVLPVVGFLNESQDLEVTRHKVGLPKNGHPAIRIAQVSDLHVVGQDLVEQKAIQALAREDPDVVVLTGDILPYQSRQKELEAFLEQLPKRASKWAIMGNWEYKNGIDINTLKSIYARHNVTLLINESVLVDNRFLLVGLDDFLWGEPDWNKALARHKGWPGARLILAHNPMTASLLPKTGLKSPDTLLLAGHTHGGQIVLFDQATQLMDHDAMTCLSGWCDTPHVNLYVTRGIGTSILPIRIGARPELSFFEWFL